MPPEILPDVNQGSACWRAWHAAGHESNQDRAAGPSGADSQKPEKSSPKRPAAVILPVLEAAIHQPPPFVALGGHPRVRMADITEIDASLDSEDGRTVRLAALVILEIATSRALHKQ